MEWPHSVCKGTLLTTQPAFTHPVARGPSHLYRWWNKRKDNSLPSSYYRQIAVKPEFGGMLWVSRGTNLPRTYMRMLIDWWKRGMTLEEWFENLLWRLHSKIINKQPLVKSDKPHATEEYGSVEMRVICPYPYPTAGDQNWNWLEGKGRICGRSRSSLSQCHQTFLVVIGTIPRSHANAMDE